MMNETGIRPQIIQEIKELAQKYGIQKVILFGSRARGDYRKVSQGLVEISKGRVILILQSAEEILRLLPWM